MELKEILRYFTSLGVTFIFVLDVFHCPAMGGAFHKADFECHTRYIQACLKPSMQYLQNVSNIYGANSNGGGGILQTTLHFFMASSTLNTGGAYHTSSFHPILVKLDDVFSHRIKLLAGCRIFKAAEDCLYLKKQRCDEEVRAIVEGIENVFDLVCNEKYMKAFQKNEVCLMDNRMKMARLKCDHDLQETIEDIGPLITLDYGQNKKFFYEENSEVSQICNAVTGALNCYKEAGLALCGEKSAEWEHRLRHDLVQLLLKNLNCEGEELYDYIEPLSNGCFLCADSKECIYEDVKCNGVYECTDHSDEAESLCGHGWTGLNICLLTAAAIAVIIVTAVFIVKYRENIQYTMQHRIMWRNTEMQVLNNEEEEDDDEQQKNQSQREDSDFKDSTNTNQGREYKSLKRFPPLKVKHNRYEQLHEHSNQQDIPNII